MHSAFRQSLVTGLRLEPKRPVVKFTDRHPTRIRSFHSCPSSRQPSHHDNGGDPNVEDVSSDTQRESEKITSTQAPKAEKRDSAPADNFYGSGSRRARRNKAHEEPPDFHVPQWFLQNNIHLREDGYPTWAHGLVVVDAAKRPIYPPAIDSYIHSVIDEEIQRSQQMRKIVTKLEAAVAQSLATAKSMMDRLQHVHSKDLYGDKTQFYETISKSQDLDLRSQVEKVIVHRIFRGIKLSADLNLHEVYLTCPQVLVTDKNHYHVDYTSFRDIVNIFTGLMVPPVEGFAKDPACQKVLLNLRFNGYSGHNYLRSLIAFMAELVGADLVRLDAQDISEMMGSWQNDCGGDFKSARLMSYDVYQPEQAAERFVLPFRPAESEERDGSDADQEQSLSLSVSAIPLPLVSSRNLNKLMENVISSTVFNRSQPQWDDHRASSSRAGRPLMRNREEAQWQRLIEKIFVVVRQRQQDAYRPARIPTASPRYVQLTYWGELLGYLGRKHSNDLEADDQMRPRETKALANLPDMLSSLVRITDDARENRESTPNPESLKTQPSSNGISKLKLGHDSNDPSEGRTGDLVIHVQDFEAIQANQSGARFLQCLYDQVQCLRSQGQRVLIIGTSETAPSLLPPKDWNKNPEPGGSILAHTLFVTPTALNKVQFLLEKERRIAAVNLRHLNMMLRARLGMDTDDYNMTNNSGDPHYSLPPLVTSELGDKYLTFDEVHHLVSLLSSFWILHNTENISLELIVEAVRSLKLHQKANQRSPSRKHHSIVFDSLDDNGSNEENESDADEEDGESRHKENDAKSKRKYDRYERKLLRGVLRPDNIRTTFADVNAPSRTVDALQTLTALSIKRPDAFSYGVLSTDKMSGVLLYGPPGTGKTLLAKAMAKESGAHVLQVSGAEIWDMYVGEAEKNIRALFSLAEKLTPCVIFIDEADALFGSRGSERSTGRTSHREVINQFLKEWDGVNNDAGGAFIMVATNRPFDLDDAVLRRLPRRILVDLPTEPDRQKILQIHLKDENLAEDVNLAEVAAKSPFYSGSDLKNVCVAAALSSVKDENKIASEYQGEEAYKHPNRRTLTAKHFELALDEVSASISEDMDSLKAIKKFDEQYGDNRKDRKKSPKWGFRTLQEQNAQPETIKVRG